VYDRRQSLLDSNDVRKYGERYDIKAIVQNRYGTPDVLRLVEVKKPTPGPSDVLIRVHAASVNGSDWEKLRGKPLYARLGGFGASGKRILGSDIAGVIEAVGENVTQFQPGDEVFGETPDYQGGFAEYACSKENLLVRKPAGLTFEQAAAIPQGAVIALQGIRDKGQVQPGQQVLINGAGGSAGTFAIQLAKLYGAEVTGVDNTHKLDFMRSLGADHVIDYTREDFTRTGKQYDLILDVTASRSVFALRRALKTNGTYYVVGGSVGKMLQVLFLGGWVGRSQGKSLRVLMVMQNQKQLAEVTEMIAAGKINPVIDRRYPINEVPDALQYVGEGRALGKVIINIQM
jgi:NADPH:quinone reductase-like Zn-dependent oxidoreductase